MLDTAIVTIFTLIMFAAGIHRLRKALQAPQTWDDGLAELMRKGE